MGCCKHGNTDGECLRCEEEFLDDAENSRGAKRIAALEAENAELRGEAEVLRKELAEANSFIESLAKVCQAAEARAIEAEAAAPKGGEA